jgi:putative pyruvate formate lyase activating enzyme
VLPNQVSASKNIIDFIAGNVSKSAYVNIMDQYRPSYQALNINDLSRCVYNDEYQKIVQYAKTAGLYRGLHE